MQSGNTNWFNSLAFKILLAFIFGVLLSIVLLILFSMFVKERLPGMDLTDHTQALARRLMFDNSGQPTGFSNHDAYPLWIYQSLDNELAYRILNARGQVVLMSAGAEQWPALPQINAAIPGDFEFTRNGLFYDGTTEQFESGARRFFIQITVSERLIDFLHKSFALPFIRFGIELFSLVLLVVFGLCAWITLKYSLRPLRNISTAATMISTRSLNARLETAGVPTEIYPLIDSFNQALGRLEKGFRVQQDFLAKAAHELKTPLTLIRAEVETMADDAESRDHLLQQVEHLARQVQQLLLLAEVSEPFSYHFAEVKVGSVAKDCVQFLQPIANDERVRLTLVMQNPQLVWRADRGALFTLLKNLIENAIQHAPPESEVQIEICMQQITVRDFGFGVSKEELPLLFTRFWRGAHRRDIGAGLGLAICQEIAVAHGWELTADNAQPGLILTISRA